MQNFSASRLMLSATWELNPSYGLQYLAEAEQYDQGATVSRNTFVINEAIGRLDVDGFAGETVAGSIAHLVLSGVMMLEDGLCSRGIRSLNADLIAADANPNISGIVLEINSGGGQTTAGTELQNTITDIVKRGNTRLVVYAQTLASAALRAAIAAEHIIVASDTADVGSVGTMLNINREVLLQAKDNITLYARQSKLKNGAIRSLIDGDKEPLVDYVSDRAQGFIDSVERLRPGMRRTREQAQRLQAGDLFTGAEAAKIGLVDAVGTFADAVAFLSNPPKNNYLPRPANVGNLASNDMANENNNGGFVRLLNSLFGQNIPEDATPEQAAESLGDVNATEDNNPQVEEVVEDPQVEDRQDLTEILERVNTLTETIGEQATTIASLSDKLAKLSDKNEALESQLADAKIGKGAPVDNGQAADRSQFTTVTDLQKKFGAKY